MEWTIRTVVVLVLVLIFTLVIIMVVTGFGGDARGIVETLFGFISDKGEGFGF